ncbi:MAG TPA: toll/interleukin-1 receptor domain-containing protein [Ktedonobacteraceae bacterium]
MNTTRARATHVFISYSHANITFVHRLASDLQNNGITVWVDQSGLTPGTPDWETALRDAIGKAHAVILIASEDARKSSYVKDELRLAHDVHHLPIYPLWVAGNQWINSIPLGWGTTQYIDARGGEVQYRSALQQLIAVLSGAAPAAPLTPTSTLTHPEPYINQYPNYTPTPVGSSFPGQTQPARSGRGTATCLIAALVTLLLVGVLLFVAAVPLFNVISHFINTISGSSTGQISVTPTNINTTRTVGFSNGCSYFSGRGWDCTVTLKNISNSGDLTWTSNPSPGSVTVSPSTFNLPTQQDMQVTIMIPDGTCGKSDITFKSQNTVDVTINCS